MVGLGVRPGRPARLLRRQRDGHRRAARGDGAAGRCRGWCWPPRWWSTARAATTAPSTGRCARRREPGADLERGRFEPRCPTCGADLRTDSGHRVAPRWTRATPTPSARSRRSSWPAVWATPDRRQRRSPCATTTSTARGCRATPPTPASRPSSAPRSRPAARRGSSRTGPAAGLRARHGRRGGQPGRAGRRRQPGRLRAYNVASGEPHTIGEMAAALATAFGGPAPVVTGQFRVGDVRHVVASPELAGSELGFRAQHFVSPGNGSVRARPASETRPAARSWPPLTSAALAPGRGSNGASARPPKGLSGSRQA